MDSKAFLMDDEYTYRGRNTYLLDQYIEQVTFAKYQVQRQMEYAIGRKKQLELEVKAFAGLLVAYFVIQVLANNVTSTDGTLLFMAAQIVSTLLSAAGLFLIPACFFKIIKGSMILLMDNSENRSVVNSSARAYRDEIEECQMHLEKYRLLLEDLHRWKREIMQGGVVEDNTIHERVGKVNLKPNIQVAIDSFGKMGGSYTVLPIVITIVICFLLVWLILH